MKTFTLQIKTNLFLTSQNNYYFCSYHEVQTISKLVCYATDKHTYTSTKHESF